MRILTRITFSLLILFLISAGCVYYVPIYFKDQLRNEMLAIINQNVDAEVSLSDFDITIIGKFPDLTVKLQNLTVTGKEEFAGDTLLYAEKLALTIDIQRYVKTNDIHFLSIDLESPLFNILVLKGGKANYDIIKSDSAHSDSSLQDTTSFYLDIEQVSLKNGRVVYKDNEQKLNIAINGLTHSAKWDIEKTLFDWETHTKMASFTIDYKGIRYLNKKETEADMVVLVDTEKSLFTFKENNIRINHFTFGLEGSIGLQPNGYDLNFQFAAKKTLFKHLFSLLPGVYMEDLKQIKTNGDVAFDGFVKGIYNDSTGQLPAYRINVEVKNAMFKYDSLPKPVENIQFHLVAENKDGVLDHTILDLQSFKLTMDDNIVDGRIRIEGINRHKIEAEIKAILDLEDLDKMYPIKDLAVKGMVNMDLKASGVYDKNNKQFPSVDATISLSNGFLQTKDYPEPLEEIHFQAKAQNTTGRIEDTRAEIETLTFTLEDEPFDVKGSISNFDNYAYDISIKGKVDLAKMTKIYPLDDHDLKGIVAIDLESKGTAYDLENQNYLNIATKGQVEISDFQANSPQLPQAVRIVDAAFTFTPNKIILEKLEGYIGQSDIRLKGELTNYMAFMTDNKDMIVGSLILDSDTLNVNEWTTPSSKGSKTSTDTNQAMALIEIPKDIDFTFDSDIRYLRYDDMHISDMKGEIRIKDGILSLNETGFNSLGAKFKLSGDYNTVDIQKPSVDFDLAIQELDINKAYREISLIRSLAPAAKDVYGTLSIEYKLKSNLTKNMQPVMESLKGGGRIRIHEAKIDGMKIMNEIRKQSKKDKATDPTLKDFVMDTEIRGTKMIVKPFTLKFHDFDAEIEGVNDVSGKIDYIVKVSLLPFERIKLPFHVTGTYDKSKITIGKGKAIE